MNTKGGLTRTHNQMQEMQQKDTSLKGLIKAMEPEIKKALRDCQVLCVNFFY